MIARHKNIVHELKLVNYIFSQYYFTYNIFLEKLLVL